MDVPSIPDTRLLPAQPLYETKLATENETRINKEPQPTTFINSNSYVNQHDNIDAPKQKVMVKENIAFSSSTDILLTDFPYYVINDDSGQRIFVKPDPTSTVKDPAMLLVARNLDGQTFSRKVYIHRLDLQDTMLAELYAFRAYTMNGNAVAFKDEEIKIATAMANIDVQKPIDVAELKNIQLRTENLNINISSIGKL